MIDIKQLHVGSHILVDGEIAEIFGISHKGYTIRCDDSSFGCAFLTEHAKVEPIPITHELLQKIGFKLSYDCEDYIIWDKVAKGHKTDVMFCNGNWYVTIFELGYPTKQKVQYLHELESYVYLTLHEELIKDEL